MLQRIRTLAVQSANGTLGNNDRESIQNEVDSLTAEITRIAEQTTFGGKYILRGFTAANADDNQSIYRSGATKGDGSGATLRLHVGANTGDSIDMFVYSFVFSKIAAAAGVDDQLKTDGGPNGDQVTFSVSTQTNANLAIAQIDAIIAQVDSQRADLGAIQNRLESSIRNQSNVSTNSADARSRIRDADFAEESANLSQQSIIQQAATSMLMQANTRPQLALSMLG